MSVAASSPAEGAPGNSGSLSVVLVAVDFVARSPPDGGPVFVGAVRVFGVFNTGGHGRCRRPGSVPCFAGAVPRRNRAGVPARGRRGSAQSGGHVAGSLVADRGQGFGCPLLERCFASGPFGGSGVERTAEPLRPSSVLTLAGWLGWAAFEPGPVCPAASDWLFRIARVSRSLFSASHCQALTPSRDSHHNANRAVRGASLAFQRFMVRAETPSAFAVALTVAPRSCIRPGRSPGFWGRRFSIAVGVAVAGPSGLAVGLRLVPSEHGQRRQNRDNVYYVKFWRWWHNRCPR